MRIPPRSHGSRRVRAERSSVTRQLLLPLQEYIHNEIVGSAILLGVSLLALLWANSSWNAAYEHMRGMPIMVTLGGVVIEQDFRHWVNEGLMTVFFFVVGLEIKQAVLCVSWLRGRRRYCLSPPR